MTSKPGSPALHQPTNVAPNAVPLCAEFEDLLRRAAAGDQRAINTVFERYHKPALYAIRHLVRMPLRRVIDPEDLAQNVWKSFFRMVAEGQRFATPEALLTFLMGVVRNKVYQCQRDQVGRQKRSLAREQPLSATGDELVGPDDPAALAASEDEWAGLLRQLSCRDRAIMICLRGGDSVAEVVRMFGVSVRTIERLRASCRDYFRRGDNPRP